MLVCRNMHIVWRSDMRETVKAFKTLSEETRLRILNLILERECCVCEVMQALQISQSKASRGLTALYDAGFLKQRKEGLWSLYSIDTETKDYLSDLIKAARKALKDNKVAALDKERLQKAERVGPGCAGKACKTPLSAETS
jgi:ArsR family transcriptional regulator